MSEILTTVLIENYSKTKDMSIIETVLESVSQSNKLLSELENRLPNLKEVDKKHRQVDLKNTASICRIIKLSSLIDLQGIIESENK